MKTASIKIASAIILFISLCFTPSHAHSGAFDASFKTTSGKGRLGTFKAQKLKGKFDGMGIVILKDKSTYIGDLHNNKTEGVGIKIADSDESLTNVPGCAVFVGNFKDNKKSGHGICYSEDGDIIYSGEFENDLPKEEYPSAIIDSTRYFSAAESEGFRYIGEFSGLSPDGMGIILFDNGDFIISRFKDGIRMGIGLYMSENGEWETQNCKASGEIVTISSSDYYRQIDSERNANFNASLSEAFGYFKEAAQTGADIGRVARGNSRTHTDRQHAISADSPSEHERQSSLETMHNNNNTASVATIQARNRDENTYMAFESQLSKMKSGNTQYSESEKTDIQRKMRSIRKKWKVRGLPMHFISELENW